MIKRTRSEIVSKLRLNREKENDIEQKIQAIKKIRKMTPFDIDRIRGLRAKRNRIWEENRSLQQEFMTHDMLA